jgi:microcystin-dependent protein
MCIGESHEWNGPLTTLPAHWLLCDGSAVSRATYADLFAVIGTHWGVGDGSTTFNLPQKQGRSPIGVCDSLPLGTTTGEAEHLLSIDELPAHSHTVQPFAPAAAGGGGVYAYSGGAGAVPINSDACGGGLPHNNLHPVAAAYQCIEALPV